VNAVEAQWGPRFGGRTDWFVAGDVDPTVMLIVPAVTGLIAVSNLTFTVLRDVAVPDVLGD
jgi:hypothetical protein